jgi:hypothetical protein
MLPFIVFFAYGAPAPGHGPLSWDFSNLIIHTVGLVWTSDYLVGEASIYTEQHNM